VHIAYENYGSLKYARKSADGWMVENLDPAADATGGFVSLAIDSKGNPHIAYSLASGGGHSSRLKYASKGDGTWTVETVDGLSNPHGGLYVHVGWFTSLALDAEDTPHVAYYDHSVIDFSQSVGNLKYASKNSGTWTVETVDAAGDVGKYASLALDAKGNPHISYTHTTGGGRSSQLRYASKSGGRWATIEYLATPGSEEWNRYYTSLAVDAEDNPHILYYEMTEWMREGNLEYATKRGRVWTFETVDSVGNGGEASLAFDAKANPHIAYHKSVAYYGPSELKYAIRSGGSWTGETVDSGGYFPSLALDNYGDPHIAHYDLANLHVKYASRR
jgi:hypothetical protein